MNDLEVLALKLGLPQNSTQEAVDAHLASLQAKAGEADQLKIDAKTKEKEANKKAITDMFANAIKDKKLNAKQAEGMQKWAESDFEGCKAHIDGLPTIDAISKGINGTSTPSASAAAVAEKGFEALTEDEQKDLLENDPEAYAAKYEAYLDGLDKK